MSGPPTFDEAKEMSAVELLESCIAEFRGPVRDIAEQALAALTKLKSERDALSARVEELERAFREIRLRTPDSSDNDLLTWIAMEIDDALFPERRAPLRSLLSPSTNLKE